MAGLDVTTLVERTETPRYRLGFTPAQAPDGAFHEVRVKVKSKGARARSPAGYVAKPLEARLSDLTMAALLLDQRQNPLGMEVTLGVPTPGQKVGQQIVGVEMSVATDQLVLLERNGRRVGQGELYIAARDAAGNLSARKRWVDQTRWPVLSVCAPGQQPALPFRSGYRKRPPGPAAATQCPAAHRDLPAPIRGENNAPVHAWLMKFRAESRPFHNLRSALAGPVN